MINNNGLSDKEVIINREKYGENIFTNIVDDIKYESDYASYSNTIFKYLPPIFYKWFNKRKQFPVTEGFKCYLRDFV